MHKIVLIINSFDINKNHFVVYLSFITYHFAYDSKRMLGLYNEMLNVKALQSVHVFSGNVTNSMAVTISVDFFLTLWSESYNFTGKHRLRDFFDICRSQTKSSMQAIYTRSALGRVFAL